MNKTLSTKERIKAYIESWKDRGYPDDIPDEVPTELQRLMLAPSYKAICEALLKNDLYMTDLGFSAPKSKWYSVLKRIELAERVEHNSSE